MSSFGMVLMGTKMRRSRAYSAISEPSCHHRRLVLRQALVVRQILRGAIDQQPRDGRADHEQQNARREAPAEEAQQEALATALALLRRRRWQSRWSHQPLGPCILASWRSVRNGAPRTTMLRCNKWTRTATPNMRLPVYARHRGERIDGRPPGPIRFPARSGDPPPERPPLEHANLTWNMAARRHRLFNIPDGFLS